MSRPKNYDSDTAWGRAKAAARESLPPPNSARAFCKAQIAQGRPDWTPKKAENTRKQFANAKRWLVGFLQDHQCASMDEGPWTEAIRLVRKHLRPEQDLK